MGICKLLLMIYGLHFAVSSAVCPNPRVRKSWGAMTADEQNLYVEAVGYGMRRGYHILFTELHSETQSSTEAYRTCGFLYWNRRFLLAYENMLRSLGTKYECVTIPYWDYFADYARFLVGNCDGGGSSIESCSPILRGLGGSSGTPRDVTINGQTIRGRCVASGAGSSFCESSSLTNSTKCAKCIPRSDWSSKTFPSGFGYAGLAVLLSQSNGFRQFSNAIQYGIHNTIHDALSSTMATFMGPADPIFFSHHATVDMLHQMYLDCQLGNGFIPTSERISRFAYQKCSYRGEWCPESTSNVTQLWMRARSIPGSVPAVPAEKHSTLSQFFSPVPNKYWQLISIKSLGTQAYSYQLDDLVKSLQKNGFVCPRFGERSSSRRATADDTEFNGSHSEIALKQEITKRQLWSPPSGWANWWRSFAAALSVIPSPSPTPTTPAPTPTPTSAPTSADLTTTEDFTDLSGSSVDSVAGVEIPDYVPKPPASGFNYNYNDAQVERAYVQDQSEGFLSDTIARAKSVDGSLATAYTQTELMECQLHEDIAAVQDYSSFFRDNFQIDSSIHPRCYNLLYQTNDKVRVSNWRDLANRFYNCALRRTW